MAEMMEAIRVAAGMRVGGTCAHSALAIAVFADEQAGPKGPSGG